MHAVGKEKLEVAQLLKKAAMYLGLLSLDGEASGMDVSASVRYLRLAACAGTPGALPGAAGLDMLVCGTW